MGSEMCIRDSAWLARAQPALTRMHRLDGASSSSEGSSQWSAPSVTSSEDERQSAAAKAEAERRSGTADYVEARGSLQPAIDYLERALAAATAQRSLSGELLATVCTSAGCTRSNADMCRPLKHTCRWATLQVHVSIRRTSLERYSCSEQQLQYRAIRSVDIYSSMSITLVHSNHSLTSIDSWTSTVASLTSSCSWDMTWYESCIFGCSNGSLAILEFWKADVV